LYAYFVAIENCLAFGDPAVLDVIENVVLHIYNNQLARKVKRDTLQLDANKF